MWSELIDKVMHVNEEQVDVLDFFLSFPRLRALNNGLDRWVKISVDEI